MSELLLLGWTPRSIAEGTPAWVSNGAMISYMISKHTYYTQTSLIIVKNKNSIFFVHKYGKRNLCPFNTQVSEGRRLLQVDPQMSQIVRDASATRPRVSVSVLVALCNDSTHSRACPWLNAVAAPPPARLRLGVGKSMTGLGITFKWRLHGKRQAITGSYTGRRTKAAWAERGSNTPVPPATCAGRRRRGAWRAELCQDSDQCQPGQGSGLQRVYTQLASCWSESLFAQ